MAQTLNPTSYDLKKILKDNCVLCVYGSGDGTLYKKVKSWLHAQEDHYIIFVEEDEQLFLQGKQRPWANDPQVRLFFYIKGDQEIFSKISWEFLFLKMAYLPLFEGTGDEFFKELDHFQNGVTLLASDWRDMGEKVLNNLVSNMRFFPSSFLGDSLKGTCKGVPAIVCGAGPSLDKAMADLNCLKERAVVLAAGTAVNALNAQGINPHLFAYVDPDPPRDRFLSQQTFEIPCLYQSRFSSDLLSYVHGKRIWMPGTGNYPLEEWLASSCGIHAECIESGWTVATFGVYAALHLGCNPIFLAGMDFCCTPDTVYASGVRGEENREQLIVFKDDQGKTWHSKRDWLMSAQWLTSIALAHPERTWINVSEGLPIQGIEKKDLATAAASYLTWHYDIDAQLFSALYSSLPMAVESEKTRNIAIDLKESFEKCGRYCDELLLLWEKSFPDSPLTKAEYALIEVELDTEIASNYFLSPLWDMWKHPILRTEAHPFGKHLHRILFYKKAVEVAVRVLS